MSTATPATAAWKQTGFHKTLVEIQNRARDVYPAIKGFNAEGKLKVSDLHTIAWAEAGNPKGKPVLLLHGGPGGAAIAEYARAIFRYHNPEKYRIIAFDQRGCGLSTPFACCEDNTTFRTVEDAEVLREHLKIEKWQVFGGSFGSTATLCYAILHPDRCSELVLRGIFTLRRNELQWFYQFGVSEIFPEKWEEYLKPIPEAERGDLIAAYHKRLFGDDEKVKLECAQAWSIWEGSTCLAVPDTAEKYGDPEFCLPFARIENHYFFNKGFYPDGKESWIFDNAHKIKDVPFFAVHGRYDSVCCYEAFHQLKKVAPHGEFVTAPLSGHSATDPDISALLCNATDKFAENWKPSEESA